MQYVSVASNDEREFDSDIEIENRNVSNRTHIVQSWFFFVSLTLRHPQSGYSSIRFIHSHNIVNTTVVYARVWLFNTEQVKQTQNWKKKKKPTNIAAARYTKEEKKESNKKSNEWPFHLV